MAEVTHRFRHYATPPLHHLGLGFGISATSIIPTDLVAWVHFPLSVNPCVKMSAAISDDLVYLHFTVVSVDCPVIISCSVAIDIR